MMWSQRLPGRCKRRSCRYGAIARTRLAVGLTLFSADSVDGRGGGEGFGINGFVVALGLMRRPEVFQWLRLGRVLDKIPIFRSV